MDRVEFKTMAEIMRTRFPEDRQIRRIKRPNAIRFNLDDFGCDIHMDTLQSEADLVQWIYYFSGKQWITGAILSRFIELVAEERGFNLHDFVDEPEKPFPPALGDWFMDHPEITVKQLADLEGIAPRRAQEKLSALVAEGRLTVCRTEGRKKFYALRRAQL
ncbi:MAG: hypothetical protein M8357_00570 [Desulfobulbaceae bacterium]|nr:hypothetical protein [Desulfobulbaceae bacterium]